MGGGVEGGGARDQYNRNDRACDRAEDVVEAVFVRLYSVINVLSLKICRNHVCGCRGKQVSYTLSQCIHYAYNRQLNSDMIVSKTQTYEKFTKEDAGHNDKDKRQVEGLQNSTHKHAQARAH